MVDLIICLLHELRCGDHDITPKPLRLEGKAVGAVAKDLAYQELPSYRLFLPELLGYLLLPILI